MMICYVYISINIIKYAPKSFTQKFYVTHTRIYACGTLLS